MQPKPHMYSQRDLKHLPAPAALERRIPASAVIECVLMPEWMFRWHSFDARWGDDVRAHLGSMRDGSGDHWHAVFRSEWTLIKGLVRPLEQLSARPNLSATAHVGLVPERLHTDYLEPAFYLDETGFCLWHVGTWSGFATSAEMAEAQLARFDLLQTVENYVDWAREVFEHDLAASDLAPLWKGDFVPTRDWVRSINEHADPEAVLTEVSDWFTET